MRIFHFINVFVTFWLYRNYRFSSSVKLSLQRRFTPAGGLVIAAMFVAAGIGVDTSQAMAYQGFTLLLCLLLLSFIWSLFSKVRLTGRRFMPRVGTAGQPLHYTVVVSNPGDRLQDSIGVAEDTGDPRPTFVEFANTPEPGEKRRNPFDRFFRFYRWMWLVSLKQVARSIPAKIPAVPPGKQVEVAMQLVPHRRGRLSIQGLIFTVPDPFGLCRSHVRFPAPEKILILPRRYIVPNLDLGGTMQYHPGGVSLASSSGQSEEFMSVREYRRGDPLRHVHWKSTSKTGKLIVKEFQNEFFVRHALILDTFLEKNEEAVFEEAVSIAASFACALNTQESLLDLLFVGAQAYSFPAGQGVSQVDHMLEILAGVQPATEQKFSNLEALVLRQIALVSGCVCVFLKWDDERRALVEKMSAMAVPVVVLVLKSKGQPNPDFGPDLPPNARIHLLEQGKIQEGLTLL